MNVVAHIFLFTKRCTVQWSACIFGNQFFSVIWWVLIIIAIFTYHYCDVIMGTMASQITSLTIVYSIVHSDINQRKHQSAASQAFVWGIYRWPVNSPHKRPVTRKMFPFDDVIMIFMVVLVIHMQISTMISWHGTRSALCTWKEEINGFPHMQRASNANLLVITLSADGLPHNGANPPAGTLLSTIQTCFSWYWLFLIIISWSVAYLKWPPWASYQIRKTAACAFARNDGNVFPATVV